VGRGGHSLLRVTGCGDVCRARVIGKLSLVSNVERPTILLVNAHSNYRSTSISCYLIWRASLINEVLKTKVRRNPDSTFQNHTKELPSPTSRELSHGGRSPRSESSQISDIPSSHSPEATAPPSSGERTQRWCRLGTGVCRRRQTSFG